MNAFSKVIPANGQTIFNLPDEELQRVEAFMRPGKFAESSGCGFLAENESLKEVCIRDLTTLDRLGISCEQISLTLFGLVRTARKAAEGANTAIIAGRFKLTGFGIGTNGYQRCPFDHIHKGRFDYVVTNLKTNESLSFSELVIDLIGKHAFFEGNVDYRVDPEKACRILELKPGECQKVTEKTWKWASGGECEPEAIAAAEKYAEKKCKIDQHATAYLGLPYTDYETYENRNKPMPAMNPQLFIVTRREPVPVEVGKKYCHIFNLQDREANVKFNVDGIEVSVPIQYEGCYIFELIEESFIAIN